MPETEVEPEQLETYVQQYFGYEQFQPGQKAIMTDVLAGKDVLGILPTGSGKSLCYQLPAKVLPGLTIVVSPLISLMIDQVRQIKAYAYKEVAALHSFLDYQGKQMILQELNRYKLIFVSPELLQQPEIMAVLKKQKISLFVIDEAHCISQWGYEFRPDYLRLKTVMHELGQCPVLALTGTAAADVQDDICRQLERPDMVRHVFSMERTNIAFIVEDCLTAEEKDEKLRTYLNQVHAPSLIYFSSRKKAEAAARMLRDALPDRSISFYHAGMEKMERLKVQQQFIEDQLDIICCTSAFGMGINKPNIRLIIHYHLPAQLESFIQEVGRAGRDGNESVSIVLYNKEDWRIPSAIIDNELPDREEITYVFTVLEKLVQTGKSLPKRRDQAEELFQLGEVKWRFLYYQLEMRGVIAEGEIDADQTRWQQVMQEIFAFCTARITEKHRKLQELVHWAESSTCFRKALYRTLQEDVLAHVAPCCSQCGFTLKEWAASFEPVKRTQGSLSWQTQLRTLLLQET